MHGQFPLMLVVGVDTLKGVALGRSRGASSQTGPRCIGVGEDGVTASNKPGGMDNGLDDGLEGVVESSLYLARQLDLRYHRRNDGDFGGERVPYRMQFIEQETAFQMIVILGAWLLELMKYCAAVEVFRSRYGRCRGFEMGGDYRRSGILAAPPTE
jgi:hypothetical protein